MKCLLIRYNEIGLKGQNIEKFQEILAKNIRFEIHHCLTKIGIDPFGDSGKFELEKKRHRLLFFFKNHLFIHSPDFKYTFEQVRICLQSIFGISSISEIEAIPTSIETIETTSIQLFQNQFTPEVTTFAIRVSRREKAFDFSSKEIEIRIGSHIQKLYPTLTVKLREPQLTLHVEITKKESFIWMEGSALESNFFAGLNGLPVSSSGHLLALLSGGIDSPVAAYQLMKRGASMSFVHFFGTPFVGNDVLQKVTSLYRQCIRFHPFPKPLYIVPFGKIQEELAKNSPPEIRTLLYRRMMLRISSYLSRKINAKALITGESLGQVASQTIDNLSVIEEASKYPILRPLISLDKSEIISLAKKIGTYETSIQPGLDCCTLFADKSPLLYTQLHQILEIEKNFPCDEIAFNAYKNIDLVIR